MRLSLRVAVPFLALLGSAAACGAQAITSAPQSAGVATSAVGTGRGDTSRRKVRVQAKSRSIMPKAKDLVSTSESGASRQTTPPLTLTNVSVSGADGKAVTLQPQAQKGHWLLVYRSAPCVACDRLMAELSKNNGSTAISDSNLVILVGTPEVRLASKATANGTVKPVAHAVTHAKTAAEMNDELTAVRSKFSALDNAAWRYDNNAEASHTLKLSGYPMLYGMDGAHIVWRSAGILPGIGQKASSWLASPSTASRTAPTQATAAPAQ